MNRSKSQVVALTRFSGLLQVFYGVIAATYVLPYYHRYNIVFEHPDAHSEATLLLWLAVLQAILRAGVGLFLYAKAEGIIDSLCAPEADPTFRSLIVALVKLSGFLLLFYAVTSAVTPDPVVFNLLHNGSSALAGAGPELFRITLNLLVGFLIVARADKILDAFERLRGDAR